MCVVEFDGPGSVLFSRGMGIRFEELQEDQTFVGSKAYVLAQMARLGLPVPPGFILTEAPKSEAEWSEIVAWWKSIDSPPLAVRSSAFGEDSKELSFAGQNQSFLNVETEAALREAVEKCFDSIDRESSRSYRQFFMGSERAVPMNVVLQQMVQARYSGVYFSVNPLKSEDGPLLEYVEGFGEALVSGQVNPFRHAPGSDTHDGPLDFATLQNVLDLGRRVETQMRQPIDMEWALDGEGGLCLLQARPITASQSQGTRDELVREEFDRIERTSGLDTWWDGQTFCEWTGNPSTLSFEIWKGAFAPGGALDLALHELGYIGFVDRAFSPHESILDRLFGRAFVNMEKFLPLYFGPIPYRVEPAPRPHLKFSPSKMTWTGILRTPLSIGRMMSVAWKLSTRRRFWIDKSRKDLLEFKNRLNRPTSASCYQNWNDSDLLEKWVSEVEGFSRDALKWPLVLAILIESSYQALEALLRSIVGAQEAGHKLRRWMGAGISTSGFEMNQAFRAAVQQPREREFFISRFGHRGPGEMDLSHPRWCELGEAAFAGGASPPGAHQELNVDREIEDLKSLKESVVREEWNLLKELLELREHWKMEILRPYAHLRFLALEMGRRRGLGLDVFALDPSELQAAFSEQLPVEALRERVRLRRVRARAYRSVCLPDVLLRSELQKKVYPDPSTKISALRGLSLSGGSVRGHVRIVRDPRSINLAEWPDDAILVASATDPGWTALLAKAKGVIVERGGVLSHCAIVAREMNLPAINLPGALGALRDGDSIWLDGDQGSVTNELSN